MWIPRLTVPIRIILYTVVTAGEEVNAALIGSTVGVAAFLVITGIVFFALFFIVFGVHAYRKKRKMAMYVS